MSNFDLKREMEHLRKVEEEIAALNIKKDNEKKKIEEEERK
jgi:hypothetical protein